MSNPNRAALWQRSFHDVQRDFGSSGLVVHFPSGPTSDGNYLALDVNSESSIDLSFASCVQGATRYLKMKPGEVALINDPTTGGSSLGNLTLIRCCSLKSRKANSEAFTLFACERLQFYENFDSAAQSAALRIPPTLICVGNEPNKTMLGAIAAHPQAPLNLVTRLEASLARLKILEQRVARTTSLDFLELNRSSIEDYFADSNLAMKNWISKHLASGEYSFSHELSGGEIIKLRIEVRENQPLLFDFARTGASENFQLTEFMSFAACMSALIALSPVRVATNQGSFSAIGVRTPQGSMLQSKRILNPLLATSVHTPQLCNFVYKSLLSLFQSSERFAETAGVLGPVFLSFKDRLLSLELPGGGGATQDAAGSLFKTQWKRSMLDTPFSVEELERDFKVRVNTISGRGAAEAKGLHRGGGGLQLSLTFLEPAEFSIYRFDPKLRAKGIRDGKHGHAAEIMLQVGADGSSEAIEPSTKMTVAAGSTLRFLSGGGGAWGAEVKDEE